MSSLFFSLVLPHITYFKTQVDKHFLKKNLSFISTFDNYKEQLQKFFSAFMVDVHLAKKAKSSKERSLLLLSVSF